MTDASYHLSGQPFPSFDIDAAGVNLSDLHSHVFRNCARVELVRRGETCVLIAKHELDSLEKALEILSDNDAVRAVRDQIALVAHLAVPPPPPATSYSSRIRPFES